MSLPLHRGLLAALGATLMLGCSQPAPLAVPVASPLEAPGLEVASYQLEAMCPPARAIRVTIDGRKDVASYANAVDIAGPIGTITHVATRAYDDVAKRRPFPAMLGVTFGTFGYEYARITPANANNWSADHGQPGPVAFLDSTNGLGDNAGAWVFTHQRAGGGTTVVTASATSNVTTWNPAHAVAINLGATTRNWQVTGTSSDPNWAVDGAPGILVVYSHPDGTRDFTLALGNVGANSQFPGTIRTQGYVYAFDLTIPGTLASVPNATLVLTPKP